MTDSTAKIPQHTIRVSPRAHRPRLMVTPEEGLVVVLPRSYPTSGVPEILRRHSAWIERTLRRTEAHRHYVASAADLPIPDIVDLPGLALRWRVELSPTGADSVRGRARDGVLTLSGRVSDRQACFDALRSAVARAARERLPLILGGIEAETGWQATGVTIRRQRTRWGSCTARRTLSLNESLVFLPPHLVRHVLVHELAHTQRMDHSPEFWALVATHDGAWREHRRELREAWQHVPAWHGVR